MSRSTPSQRTVWLVILAFILLAFIPMAIRRADTDASSSTSNKGVSGLSPSPSGLPRSSPVKSKRSKALEIPPTHQTKELESFLIPPMQLHNVTLEEAIETLITRYREVCRETGESPIDFHYSVKGNPEPIVYLQLQRNFLSNCRFIASMAATSLKIEGTRLIFTEIPDGPIVQRRWTVPPDFDQSLPDLDDQGRPVIHPPNPFAAPPPRPGVTELLSNLGVLGEDSLASFLPESGTLIIRAGMKDHVRNDGLVLNAIHSSPQSLITIQEGPAITLAPGNLGTIQRPSDPDTGTPGLQLLISSVEKGFGREIKTITFTGDFPGQEARNRYLESGNLSELGLSENLTVSTHFIMRGELEEPASFSVTDENGLLHEIPFQSYRIEANERPTTIPGSAQE